MKQKRLAIIIMLIAGIVMSISCILFKVELVPSILIVVSTMLIFYLFGRLITKLIDKINTDAENRAVEVTKTDNRNEETIDADASQQEEAADQNQTSEE